MHSGINLAFQMKVIFIGSAIIHDVQNNSILISQKNYIEDIAANFHSHITMSYKTPIPLGINFTTLANEDEEPKDTKKFPYHELISSLMYATTVSWPDIAYSVNKLARYTTKPSQAHWNLAKHVLQFLYITRDQSLMLGGNEPTLYAYANADFAGDTEDRTSTCGYAIFLGNSVVSWSSKKQTIVALSSTEAKYMVLLEAVWEVLWLRQFLQEIGIEINGPTTIYQDNLGTKGFALNKTLCAT